MIKYHHNYPLDPQDVARVFDSSGLIRPSHDIPRTKRMLDEANLTISAWDEKELIGLCRALTDFSYCCYLSDLAVNTRYQGKGIGKRLIGMLREAIGEEVSLILLSSASAMSYYPHIGLSKADNAFVLKRSR